VRILAKRNKEQSVARKSRGFCSGNNRRGAVRGAGAPFSGERPAGIAVHDAGRREDEGGPGGGRRAAARVALGSNKTNGRQMKSQVLPLTIK
jgi:hypothetical protein